MVALEDIDRFLSFSREQFNLIRNSQFSRRESHFKTILYYPEFEVLARTVYPKALGPRDKIVALIRDFSDWEDRNKVSLPHLIRLLEKKTFPGFDELRDWAVSRVSSWSTWQVLLSNDMEYNEIESMWPSNIPADIGKLTHANLFYNYRNYLMHEGRSPSGVSFPEDKKPHYQSRSDENGNHRWMLRYPLKFYEEISENILKNIRKYYTEHHVNLYECFHFGPYWLEKLNT